MFNESGISKQITSGLLIPEYLRNDHLKHPEERGLPYCTRAQMIRYLDFSGQQVAEVFQYKRPDGNLGASGLPDPKRLWIGDKEYHIRI